MMDDKDSRILRKAVRNFISFWALIASIGFALWLISLTPWPMEILGGIMIVLVLALVFLFAFMSAEANPD